MRIRQENVTWREVGGEIIALDLTSSMYFSTNKTGALLWNALVDGASAEQLVSLLEERYGLSKEVAEKDVRSFLALVAEHGLLERT